MCVKHERTQQDASPNTISFKTIISQNRGSFGNWRVLLGEKINLQSASKGWGLTSPEFPDVVSLVDLRECESRYREKRGRSDVLGYAQGEYTLFDVGMRLNDSTSDCVQGLVNDEGCVRSL